MFELSLEPTNECNLQCNMCPHPLQSRVKGFMDWNLYCKIIDDINSIGPIRKLHMQVLGESFLHPRIVDMINYAEGAAYELHVNTNGLPFLKEKLRKEILVSSLRSLTFSINAHSRETYARMQGRDCYESCCRALELLIGDKHQNGGRWPKLFAKMVLDDANRHEWPAFKQYWEHLGVDKAIYKETMDWHGSLKEYSRNFKTIPRWRCHYLWNNMTILWNGDVVPCCIDWDGEVVFGNAKDQHIMDIFLGKSATKFRQNHLKHKYHSMCENCEYWRWDTRFREIDTDIENRDDFKFRSVAEK